MEKVCLLHLTFLLPTEILTRLQKLDKNQDHIWICKV